MPTWTPAPTPTPRHTPTPIGWTRAIPRNRTFISTGWEEVPLAHNMSPYSGSLGRRGVLPNTIYEALFYTNFNTGEIIPWQGKKWEFNDDYTEITIYLRDTVKWADGERFDADDVVFTFEMLKEQAPAMLFSGTIAEWVKEVTKVDDFTVRLTLTKPGPRFALDYLAQGQVGRFVVVPEHIWRDQDPMEFTAIDPDRGWPVGTGPYSLSRCTDDAQWFDLRPNWWAVDAGLVPAMPKVERQVIQPVPTGADMATLYINNELDGAAPLAAGIYVAAHEQNPNLVVWNPPGPTYGAPDGCTFRLEFNNQDEFWGDPDIHWAINHAINRAEINLLAYENSQGPAVAPISSYGGVHKYVDALKPLFDKWNADDFDISKTAAILEGKGFYKKGGVWVKPDGSPFPVTIFMGSGNPIGPVLAEQLVAAGFDAVFEVLAGAAYWDALSVGTFVGGGILFTHCGSIYDPWQTLDHFHCRHVPPPGEKVTTTIRANTRYCSPEMSALIDQMEAMVPSPDDPEYVALVGQALDIYFRDLPEINMLEEFHTLVFNTTYWTGYPDKDNPYVAPYQVWDGFNLIIHRLQPTQ